MGGAGNVLTVKPIFLSDAHRIGKASNDAGFFISLFRCVKKRATLPSA